MLAGFLVLYLNNILKFRVRNDVTFQLSMSLIKYWQPFLVQCCALIMTSSSSLAFLAASESDLSTFP